jgi:hypothetical protein
MTGWILVVCLAAWNCHEFNEYRVDQVGDSYKLIDLERPRIWPSEKECAEVGHRLANDFWKELGSKTALNINPSYSCKPNPTS